MKEQTESPKSFGSKQKSIKSSSRVSLVRPVSQIVLSFAPNPSKDEFDRIRTSCLIWISDRAGRPLPPSAWSGESFELEEVGAQRAGAVGIEAPRYWTARLDDADKQVPRRVWVTEMGLGEAPNKLLLFGVRLTCVTRGEDEEFTRSIPGFVRPLIESGGAMLDGRLIGSEPKLVSDQATVDDLVDLLCDPAREADVIVFSLPEGSSNPSETAIPALEVHQSTLGAAHVIILTSAASFLLSDQVGKEFSVFRQGVRTYVTGFSPEFDQPSKHPLTLAARIANWSEGGTQGYKKMLVSRALARSVAKPNREHLLPSFSAIRSVASRNQMRKAREAGSTDRELLKLAEEEIVYLTKTMQEERENNNELLKTADEEREEALQIAQQAKVRTEMLGRRVELLNERLRSFDREEDTVSIPSSLENIQNWCEEHLSGDVELHNRAYQGIKKSKYQDSKLIYSALLLLRDYYVPMKRNGGAALQDQFITKCNELGLEESATFSGDRWGQEGETYKVNYAGRKRLLDRHLKKGSSKDERYSFRLYFFWDDNTEQVIVGWLPSHLDNSMT